MYTLKISLITVCFNAASTLRRSIESVIGQDYPNIEYIIIDGGSTDGSVQITSDYKSKISVLVSEPDNGLYDAMNKGIARATGDVIGMLNADDFFTSTHIISEVARAFEQSEASVVYGNINYVDSADHITRRWKAGRYKEGIFNWGWMPPHPSFYAKKDLFEKWGNYRTNYGSAADYELMLRFMHRHQPKVFYLDKIIVHMQVGGVSNKNLINRVKAYENDFRAMKSNNVKVPIFALLLKPMRKILQFL